MPDGVTIRFDIRDFKVQLDKFERKVQNQIGRRALTKGAKVFRHLVQQRAPVLETGTRQRIPGLLRRQVGILKSKFAAKGELLYNVGVRRKRQSRSAVKRLKAKRKAAGRATQAFYWYFLEAGWAPRRPGQALRGGVRRKTLQRQINRAGGARFIEPTEHQFIKPAFEAGKASAFLAITREMDKAIDEENKRVR